MSPDLGLWKLKQHIKPAFSTPFYISQEIDTHSQGLKPAGFLRCIN